VIRIGTAPMNWNSDDLPDLRPKIPIPQVLREMVEAGYEGTEYGTGLPSDPKSLKAMLEPHGLALASMFCWIRLEDPDSQRDEIERAMAIARTLSAMAVRELILGIRGSDRRIAVEVPPARLSEVDPAARARIYASLGLTTPPASETKVVDVGPRWMVLELADAAAVRALAPDLAAIAEASRALGITGVTAFGRARAADHALAVRSFAPAEGIPEDPVCGSGNAAIGVLLDAAGALPGAGREYVASQGRELGRDGYVNVRVDPETRRTWIGGHAVTCIDGTRPE